MNTRKEPIHADRFFLLLVNYCRPPLLVPLELELLLLLLLPPLVLLPPLGCAGVDGWVGCS